MTEELLHFIWKYRVFHTPKLTCTNGSNIEIVDQGIHNTDAGPDFFNAKIKIDGTLWAGNVEIHTKASDWALHDHHKNPSYNNVILHVVWQDDQAVLTQSNLTVPTLQIEASPHLLDTYRTLMGTEPWLTCHSGIHHISHLELANWLERCLVSKLEERTDKMHAWLNEFNGDWDQVFFVLLSRSFGFGTNAQPFEMMARQTPVKVLLHHADNQLQLEALLLGQAGFLTADATDDYHKKLIREYNFLATKYQLSPIDGHLMKFLRLRPSNFPTIRLVQLAAFIYKSKGQWDRLTKHDSPQPVMEAFRLEPSEYWKAHYMPGGPVTKTESKCIGHQSQQLLVANAIVPFMFAYAVHRGNPDMQQKALEWLEQLPPEKNHILDNWLIHGNIKPQNEFDAQALVFLRTHFCEAKKCLQCRIGLQYLAKKQTV